MSDTDHIWRVPTVGWCDGWTIVTMRNAHTSMASGLRGAETAALIQMLAASRNWTVEINEPSPADDEPAPEPAAPAADATTPQQGAAA